MRVVAFVAGDAVLAAAVGSRAVGVLRRSVFLVAGGALLLEGEMREFWRIVVIGADARPLDVARDREPSPDAK